MAGESGTLTGSAQVEQPKSEQSPNPSAQAEQGFYSYEDTDKTKYDFKSREDFDKHFREKIMPERLRHADYTKKTQGFAEDRRRHEMERLQFENDRKAHQQQVEEARKLLAERDQYDAFVKQNPRVYAELRKLKNNGQDPDAIRNQAKEIFQKEYGEDIEYIRTKRETEKQEAVEREAIDMLKSQYPDFDEKAIIPLFKKITGDEGTVQELMEHLYYASKGRVTPEKLAAEITDGLEKKKSAGLTTVQGAKGGEEKATSFDDWAEKQKAKLR